MKNLLSLLLGLLAFSSVVAQSVPRIDQSADFGRESSFSYPIKGKFRWQVKSDGSVKVINYLGIEVPPSVLFPGLVGSGSSNTTVSGLTQAVANQLYKPIGYVPTWAEIQGQLAATRVSGLAQVGTTGNYDHLFNRPNDLSAFSNATMNFQSGTQVGTTVGNATTPISNSLTTFRSSYDAFVTATNTAIGNRILGTDPRLTDARTPLQHAHSTDQVTSGVFARERIGSGTPAAGRYVDGATGAWTPLPLGGDMYKSTYDADGNSVVDNATNLGGSPASAYVKTTDASNTNSRTPTGAAGGDFTGTYPNPTLINKGTAGTFGGNTAFIQQLTVDAQGRVTQIIAGVPTGGGSGTATSGNPKVLPVFTPTIAGVQAAINQITEPGWTVVCAFNTLTIGDGERLDINNKVRFTLNFNGSLWTGNKVRTVIYCNGTSQDIRLTGGRLIVTTDNTLPYNGTYGYYGLITTQEDAKINGFEIDHMEFSNPNMPSDMIFFVNYRDVSSNPGGTAMIQNVRIHDNWAHDGGRMFYESINAGFQYGDFTVRNKQIAVYNNVCFNLGLVLDNNGNRYGMGVSQDGASDGVEVYGNFFIDGVGNDIEMVNVSNYVITGNEGKNINTAKGGSNFIGCSDNRKYLSKGGVITGNRCDVFGRAIYLAEQEDVVVTGNNFRSLNGNDFIVKQGTFSGNKFQSTRPQAAVVNFHSAVYDGGTVAWVSSDNDFLGNTVSNLGANVAGGYGGPTSLIYVYDGAMNNVFDGNVLRQGAKADGSYHGNHISFGNGSTNVNNTVGTNFTFQGAVVGYGTTITGASNATATAGQSVTTVTDNNTNTVLLLDGNGLPDNSTAINDRSSYKHTISPKATMHVTTTDKKYGTGSLSFNGTSEFLTVTASTSAAAALTFGTADFTMEYWIKPRALASGTIGGLLSKSTIADNKIAWTTGWTGSPTSFAFNISNASGTDTNPGPAATGVNFQVGVWQHVAIVSAGGVRKFYLNGAPLATSTAGTSLENSGLDGPLVLGARNTGGCCLFDGLMHVRVKKGNYYNVTGTQSFTPDPSF